MTDVTVALRIITNRIATARSDSGRESADIRLVAVSKTQPVSAISRALACGQRDFAENYLQEATVKIQALADSTAVWHYIGRIQRNKTRDLAKYFDWVQTVDRLLIAERLNAQRDEGQPPLNICLEVRLSPDPARPGVAPADLGDLARAIEKLPRLKLRGLMCMPPMEQDSQKTRAHFEHTRHLYQALIGSGHKLDTLSMGTSGDLELAIAAGSTMVRIGTDVFGPRQ